MRRNRARTRQGGFTLLELLITMVVTIFGIMGLLALHVSLSQGTDASSRTEEAVALGNQQLEALRKMRSNDMMQFLTLNSVATPPVDLVPCVPCGTKTGRNGVTYQVDVHVSSVTGSTNLWKLRVVMSWTDDASTVAHSIPFEIIRTVQDAL